MAAASPTRRAVVSAGRPVVDNDDYDGTLPNTPFMVPKRTMVRSTAVETSELSITRFVRSESHSADPFSFLSISHKPSTTRCPHTAYQCHHTHFVCPSPPHEKTHCTVWCTETNGQFSSGYFSRTLQGCAGHLGRARRSIFLFAFCHFIHISDGREAAVNLPGFLTFTLVFV